MAKRGVGVVARSTARGRMGVAFAGGAWRGGEDGREGLGGGMDGGAVVWGWGGVKNALLFVAAKRGRGKAGESGGRRGRGEGGGGEGGGAGRGGPGGQ